MLENKGYFKIKRSSERNFGLIFSVFFMIISFYPILQSQNFRLWALIIGLVFLFFGIFLPKALIIPNKLWFKFGIFLGSLVSSVTMGIIFFLTVVPTGIIIKLIGKNKNNRKINKSVKSYWIERKENKSSMRNQF